MLRNKNFEMKNKGLWITVALAILLGVGLYFGVNTVPPKPKNSPEMAGMAKGQQAIPELDIDSLTTASKKTLSQHALGELQKTEHALAALKDSSGLAPLFEQYAKTWQEHRQYPLAAYYYYLNAKLENSEKKLTFAAQLFLDLARREHDATVRQWEASNAIAAFGQILEINPNNDTAKLSLAECYFGTGDAMKGVVLVKEITSKDPENVAANLLLGQEGLVSQQFDKAKVRFETVLKKEPKNLEAMLGLAESLKALGEKDKAKAILEDCKKLIDNPEFKKDIDKFIESF